MILESVQDLWEKFKTYPSEIVYYDDIKRTEDTIYFIDGSEMAQFIDEYGNRELLDFWIVKDRLYLEFGEEVEI